MALFSALSTEIAIPVCSVIGIMFSLVLWCLSSRNSNNNADFATDYNQIESTVSEGVIYFLCKQYRYVGAFMVAFAILIFICLGSVERFSTQSRPCKFDPSNTCKPALATAGFSTVSFLLGAFTSAISGVLGTKIAIYANTRTVLEERNLIQRTSIVGSRPGAVMGFLLAAIGLLVLYLAIYLFKLYYGNDWEGLFETITSYSLGVSLMALFGRASGGIYAKAADICDHQVQDIEPNMPPDNRNPAVIPNYVGDILWDIAGMGPDLVACYTESSCAALAVASISSFRIDQDFTAMSYPMLISSMGILVCLITTLVGEIKPGLKTQLITSTILMTGGVFFVSWIALPSSFTIYSFGSQKVVKVVKNWQLSLCACVGLWAGLIIGLVNKYYTNKLFSCLKLGESVSVSLGSVSIPFFATVCILVSSRFAATYGIAVAALGMLSTIATRLAIDAHRPISDNAKRKAGLPIVTAQDAAGNTTAASGKEFPIESAALVTIALFGAFVSRPTMSSVDVLTPKIILGLIIGANLPHYFSAMIMKKVGHAAFELTPEVLSMLTPGIEVPVYDRPEYYARFFKVSTDASVRGVILPGAIVMLTPLMVGTVFGVETLSGVLASSLSSVVQIAISASNTGEGWKKANEYILAGVSECAKTPCPRELSLIVESGDLPNDPSGEIVGSGETIGNENLTILKIIGYSRKDTSGPALNILIRLMVVESLVFAPFFATHGGLLFKILGRREWTTSLL